MRRAGESRVQRCSRSPGAPCPFPRDRALRPVSPCAPPQRSSVPRRLRDAGCGSELQPCDLTPPPNPHKCSAFLPEVR